MAYVFQTDDVSTVKFTGEGRELTLSGINGVENDAGVIVNGIKVLLSVVNRQSYYDPEEMMRTVKQYVVDNS